MKIIKFGAVWCSSCKTLTETLNEMALPIPVGSIDVDEHPSIAAKYHVRGVPTLIRLDESGLEVNRLVGAKSRNELEKFFS